MPIALTDDHRELGDVARSFLTAQKARLASRALLDADSETRPAFWAEMAGLGWLGLHIEEQYGGSGYGLPELVVVIDELGRAVAPGPFVPTVVVSSVIAAVGTDEQKARLLPGIRAGRTPLYVMLDGTWREARKMFRSEYLQDLPVLGIEPEEGSRYQLREAVHKHQLCTAEVAAAVLALGGDLAAAQTLETYFETFRRHYIACKPHMVLREQTPA